ncbi:MAG: MerR family transcriptional regulator [Bacilli bacterium]
MYTIGEISKMFNLPISTLRYYDKQGLFPFIKRKSGIREFGDQEIETIKVIECLKKSGLEIKRIKIFMKWCMEGKSTYLKRKELFVEQKARVEEEIKRMNQVLSVLRYKCWYYQKACELGDEKKLKKMDLSELPDDIRKDYLSSGLNSLVKNTK